MLKFSLGSFGAFPIFTDLVHISRKRLIVERNGSKFRPQGEVFSVYRILLTVKCSDKFILVSFGDFPIFADLVHAVSPKRLIVERNEQKFEFKSLVHIEYF